MYNHDKVIFFSFLEMISIALNITPETIEDLQKVRYEKKRKEM